MSIEYRNLFDLTGKVVFCAGGAGAIGSEFANGAAALGASVAIADLSDANPDKVAAKLPVTNGRAIGVSMNVTKPQTIEEALATVEDDLGPIDALINTVGTHIEQPAEKVTMEAWDTVLNINLRGAFLLSQIAAQSMIAQEIAGSIIHVTSVRSELGIRRGYAAYCASKGGLANLIKQLATEWAKYGIRVNGIAPTFTRTPLVEEYLDDPDFYEPLVARIPMGRVAETTDLSGLALFLISDASSFITGQNIFVDGGVTATQ